MVNLALENDAGVMKLLQTADGKSLEYFIDIDKFIRKQKTFPAAKQGAFNQALGKKTKTVIDATAGWAGDSLLMCAQGYHVTMLERQPLLVSLLKDAMQRLEQSAWADRHNIVIPTVRECNAIEYLRQTEIDADCIYLDPMFPPKRKKSAATNKNIQLLQTLVGEDSDASGLLTAARESGVKRVVVKRPDYAAPLGGKPSERFSSKLVNYDVYLKTD